MNYPAETVERRLLSGRKTGILDHPITGDRNPRKWRIGISLSRSGFAVVVLISFGKNIGVICYDADIGSQASADHDVLDVVIEDITFDEALVEAREGLLTMPVICRRVDVLVCGVAGWYYSIDTRVDR